MFARRRRISSTMSKEVSLSSAVEGPPVRQELQFQLTSSAASVSWQLPVAEAMCGTIRMVSSSASARKAAASVVRK